MFFRNLTFFRFPASLDLSDLDTHLANCALKPVGALELSSRGFIPPFGRDSEALSHRIGDAIWLSVGAEIKRFCCRISARRISSSGSTIQPIRQPVMQ